MYSGGEPAGGLQGQLVALHEHPEGVAHEPGMCIYIYIYIYIYTHICIYMCLCIYTYIHIYMYIYTYANV